MNNTNNTRPKVEILTPSSLSHFMLLGKAPLKRLVVREDGVIGYTYSSDDVVWFQDNTLDPILICPRHNIDLKVKVRLAQPGEGVKLLEP